MHVPSCWGIIGEGREESNIWWSRVGDLDINEGVSYGFVDTEVYVIRFTYTEGYSIFGANTDRNRDILYEVLSVSLYALFVVFPPLASPGSPVRAFPCSPLDGNNLSRVVLNEMNATNKINGK